VDTRTEGRAISARAEGGDDRRSRAALPPLVKAHNPPLDNRIVAGKIEIYGDGSLIKIGRSKVELEKKDHIRGNRGIITGLSIGAQRRMRYSMAKVDRKITRYFVSLTYPNDFPEDPKKVARDLDCLRKRMARRGMKCHWRKELKERKSGSNKGKIAPHFHGVIYGGTYAELLFFFVTAWHEIAGNNDENHILHGINIQIVSDEQAIRKYTAKYNKYISKKEDEKASEPVSVGRMWGIINRRLIPWAPMKMRYIGDKTAFNLMRAARRCAHLKARSYKTLTILCNSPNQWGEYADYLSAERFAS
jgi:hypothetical protein